MAIGVTKPLPHIALFSVGELFGGVERQLLGLSTYLLRQGCEPVVILFYDRELAAQVRDLGLEPVILDSRHSYDPRTSRQLAGILANRRVDVVHVHGYRATVNCWLAHRRHPFRVVKTVHGKIEPARGKLSIWLKSRLYQLLDVLCTHALRAEVCYVTEDIRSSRDRYDRGLSRHTIHNGIDPVDPAATRRPDELLPDFCNLGIVGRITEVKGISFALRALASCRYGDRIRLHIIGTGELTRQLEFEAERLGVAKQLNFLGFRRNIYDYLCHLDGLLIPSLYEGLPYTLLEAMSLGTPVLASRVGGLAEVLRNGKTALLFPVTDTDAIASAMDRLIAEPELARRLGRSAQLVQRSSYSLDEMGQHYLKLYVDIVDSGVSDAV